jgi:hypothetical protein
LHEYASILRYTFFACRVKYHYTRIQPQKPRMSLNSSSWIKTAQFIIQL